MTEAEWLACVDPTPMLEFLREKASDRKLRLFGCCIRHRIWSLLVDERSRNALEVSERFADGLASADDLATAARNAFAAAEELSNSYGGDDWRYQAAAGLLWAVAAEAGRNVRAGLRSSAELNGVCRYLRDIFGNPFRPARTNPCWLNSTVVQLATGIYTDRAFDRLPMLSDALEEAGCTNRDILDHCRQPGEHVRGCWVVDLVLGRE